MSETKAVYRLDILRTYFRDIEEGETKEAALELLKKADKYRKALKEIQKKGNEDSTDVEAGWFCEQYYNIATEALNE